MTIVGGIFFLAIVAVPWEWVISKSLVYWSWIIKDVLHLRLFKFCKYRNLVYSGFSFVIARRTRYNIIWYNLSVTCDRLVVFSGYSGYLHQQNWLSWYSWKIVESGVKYHKPNPISKVFISINLIVHTYERVYMVFLPTKHYSTLICTWTINKIINRRRVRRGHDRNVHVAGFINICAISPYHH